MTTAELVSGVVLETSPRPSPLSSSSSDDIAAAEPQQPPKKARSNPWHCRYCGQSWPQGFFRNSQQFGAHCSNCSRKPSRASSSASQSVASSPLLLAQQHQQSAVGAAAAVVAAPAPVRAAAEASPGGAFSSSSGPAALFRAMSVTPTADEDACEMLITLRGAQQMQQQPQQQQQIVRSFEDVWASMARDLDDLHARVARAMAELACCRALRATAASVPSSLSFQQQGTPPVTAVQAEEEQEQGMIGLLAEFAAKEQAVRTASHDLVQASASICCTVARHVAQQQQQQQQQPSFS